VASVSVKRLLQLEIRAGPPISMISAEKTLTLRLGRGDSPSGRHIGDRIHHNLAQG